MVSDLAGPYLSGKDLGPKHLSWAGEMSQWVKNLSHRTWHLRIYTDVEETASSSKVFSDRHMSAMVYGHMHAYIHTSLIKQKIQLGKKRILTEARNKTQQGVQWSHHTIQQFH